MQNLSHHHEMNETIVNLPPPQSHPKQYHYFHPIPRILSQKQTNALLISQYTILLLQHLLLQKKEIKLISSLHQEVWMTLLVVKREPVLLSVLAIKVKPCYNFEKKYFAWHFLYINFIVFVLFRNLILEFNNYIAHKTETFIMRYHVIKRTLFG